MIKNELDKVLAAHMRWLNGEAGGQRAYLRGADLGGADLGGANLRGAYLGGAYLREAYLRGANLRGARGCWTSHDVLSEILRRAAGDDWEKCALAGLALIRRDWCWAQFAALNLPTRLRKWALATLRESGLDMEGAPEIVKGGKT